MKLVSARQMRGIEQIAIEELGIPSILLMENASIQTAKHCFRILESQTGFKPAGFPPRGFYTDRPKILIICGTGNNGGDGMAVARHLHVKGVETEVIYAGAINSAKGDAAVNLAVIQKLGIPVIFINSPSDAARLNGINTGKYDLVVDALLGTGIDRGVEGNYRTLIDAVNRYAKYVISVDVPSGVNSDTGQIMGCAVRADETVTLGFPKTGLYLFPAAEYTGIIHIEDIAIPRGLIDKLEVKTNVLTESEALKLLPVRKRRSNKGDYGKALVFAGSDDMPGAAALVCSAAYMTGCGLVRACVTRNTAFVIHRWQREVVTRVLPDRNGMFCGESLTGSSSEDQESLSDDIKNAGVIAIGPGIGRGGGTREFVFEILRTAEVPVVLDADALFAVSGNLNLLREIKAPCIITPHPGEMSRLTNLSKEEILNDTAGAALRFSSEYNVVTLLKDARTIIANPQGEVYINTTGNNALSKAGTGDALTGMIAGFIAQGLNVFEAGILGAYFHGRSCEASCADKSNYSVTAADIIDNIAAVMKM